MEEGAGTSKIGRNLPGNKELRIGVALGRPPLIHKNAFGELAGSEVALVRRFGKSRGIELEFIEYEPDELFTALRRGNIDVAVPGATEGEISSRFFAVCAPHGSTGERIVANAEIAPFITDLKQVDNANVRVYTVAGSWSAMFAKKFFKSADTASLETLEQCVEKVLKDNGCVLVTDETTALKLLKLHNEKRVPKEEAAKTPDSQRKGSGEASAGSSSGKSAKPVLALVLGRLIEERFAWAVKRSNADLKKSLDDFMSALNKAKTNPKFERVETPIFSVEAAPSTELKRSVFTTQPEL